MHQCGKTLFARFAKPITKYSRGVVVGGYRGSFQLGERLAIQDLHKHTTHFRPLRIAKIAKMVFKGS